MSTALPSGEPTAKYLLSRDMSQPPVQPGMAAIVRPSKSVTFPLGRERIADPLQPILDAVQRPRIGRTCLTIRWVPASSADRSSMLVSRDGIGTSPCRFSLASAK